MPSRQAVPLSTNGTQWLLLSGCQSLPSHQLLLHEQKQEEQFSLSSTFPKPHLWKASVVYLAKEESPEPFGKSRTPELKKQHPKQIQ